MSSKKSPEPEVQEEIPAEFAEVFPKGTKDNQARKAFHAKKAERASRPPMKPSDMGDDIITLMVKWIDNRKVRADFDRANAALQYVKQNLPKAWKQAFVTAAE